MKWKETKKGIKGNLRFSNQQELAQFVLKLAEVSDEMEHHADMEIRYNKLTLNIITHDVQRITEKDHLLCKEIERLVLNEQ